MSSLKLICYTLWWVCCMICFVMLFMFCTMIGISYKLDAATYPTCDLFKISSTTANKHYDCGSYYKVCYRDICRRQNK